MTFAWNSANEKSYAQKVGFTPFAMTFPTDQKAPELCSGIWGFGIFDSGDDARTAAAKELIHFLCDDAEQGRQSVLASHVFPVRASFGDVYNGTPDEERMNDYRKMLPYAGDYYNVTPGWTAQRTVWWNMLQQLFSGTDPQEAADWYARIANRAIDGTGQSPVPGIARNLTKRALFISSDSLNDPTVKEQIRGIQNELGENVYLHFEFMDSSAISDEDYVASFYRYISYKYSHLGGLGAIIVGDDNALQMVIRYQNGFFRDIPVVYESVNSRTLTELADSLGMTGVLAENTTDATLDIARRIYPNAAGILAVSDQSAVGSALTAHLQAVKSKYGPLKVDILDTSKLGAQQIADRVGGCGTETILLFMRFTTDAAGKAYTAQEALRLITGHAKTPVFTLEWLG